MEDRNQKTPPYDANVHEYLLEKVLCSRKDEFIRDFEIKDVAVDLKKNFLFRDDEIKEISAQKTTALRIEKLFFLIVYKNKKIETFLNVIRSQYDWLANPVQIDLKMLNDIGVEDEEYYKNIRRLRKEIPRHIDYNVHRCEYVSTEQWQVKCASPYLGAKKYKCLFMFFFSLSFNFLYFIIC